jgi:predicted phage tail protein
MNDKVRTIRIYGRLGAQFGRVHRFVVDSPAAALRTLMTMIPGFEREIMRSQERGIAYAVFADKRNLRANEYTHPLDDEEIRIAPILQGAKNSGVFQTVLGAAIIALTYWASDGTSALITPQTATIGYGIGASMVLGGVMQLLSPQQRGLASTNSADNGASYNFNGPVNTQVQGNPVPLLFGEMLVGSAVASGSIYTEDQQ